VSVCRVRVSDSCVSVARFSSFRDTHTLAFYAYTFYREGVKGPEVSRNKHLKMLAGKGRLSQSVRPGIVVLFDKGPGRAGQDGNGAQLMSAGHAG